MSSQRIAVIGAGHLGSIHAKLAQQHPQATLAAIVEPNESARNAAGQQLGAPVFATVAELPKDISAAIIATNTPSHREVAVELLSRGVPCLVEKPLALTATDAWRIIDASRAADATLAVGHTERFNPVVVAMQRMQVQPRFVETHRISPFTFRSADVGVVMDMMIHDIDIVLSLTQQPLRNVDAVGVSVLAEHEDIANARLTFEDGCVANLTASRLAMKTERKIRVFCDQAYLSLDYQKKMGIAIKKDANLDILKMARERKIDDLAELTGADYSRMVKVEPLVISDEEPLHAELTAFVDAVTGKSTPVVTAKDGLAAVQTAQRIVESIREHDWQLT